MKNMYGTPAGRSRMIRWGAGITIAGFVAGGAFAAVTETGNATPAATTASDATQSGTNTQASGASTSNAELNTLTTAAGTSTHWGRGALGRLRGIGGYYGSLTFNTKEGVRTVAFERGTIQSITGSDVVVRAPDGTTMTWLLVSDSVVRDHGKATASSLSDGQLVFVGGPVISGARDVRLIVVRTADSPKAPAKPAPASSSTANSTPVS
jgi:hypothetical protein